MAIIGELRNRMGKLLLVFVGFALVAFLLMDYFSASNGAGAGSLSVGKVGGESVNVNEYQNRLNRNLENFRRNSPDGTVDNATNENIKLQTWNDYVNELIGSKEQKKLGLTVSGDELADMLTGPNADPGLRQQFTNQTTGLFDPALVQDYMTNIDLDDTRGDGVDKRRVWNLFLNDLIRRKRDTKYTNLVSKAIGVPDFMANSEYKNSNKKAGIKFISAPYSDIPDSDIDISDSDLKSYFNANKADYDTDASRSLEYVSFKIQATAADSADLLASINELLPEFRSNGKDTLFIKTNTDTNFDRSYYSRKNLISIKSDEIFSAPEGSVVGPYVENGYYKITKVLEKSATPDSVRCSHILRRVAQGDDFVAINSLVDSLQTALMNGADWDFLAADFSQDDANKDNGGSLNWAKPGQMVKPFNDAIFYGSRVGEIKKVATNFGYHLVRIEEKSGATPVVQLGTIEREILAGPETEKRVYSDAAIFSGNNRDYDRFRAAVLENNLVEQKVSGLKINDANIAGLGTVREIVKWAFESSKGEVSDPFSLDNEYVVASVTGASSDGSSSWENHRVSLEEKVINAKKAEMLKTKLANPTNNLQAFARQTGYTTAEASDISFSSNVISGLGSEPKVVAAAMALDKGQVSDPIEGDFGIYVIKVTDLDDPGEAPTLSLSKGALETTLRNGVNVSLFPALTEAYDVKDERFKFF